jgi:Tfp pilus assembly protein PilV
MKIISLKRRQQQGSALLTVVIIGLVMCVALFAMLGLSSYSIKNAHGRVDWNKAYYIAENASVWATQTTLDSIANNVLPAAGSTTYYWTTNGTLPVAKLVSPANADPDFVGAWVSVSQPATMPANTYVITSSAQVNSKVRTLQATITAFPVSQVFDYEYFLNNWGWWWGTPIYGQGGQRSNWDFDFQGNPTLNGLLYSANLVEENEVPYVIGTAAPFIGLAGADPIDYVHDGAPRVVMPNLLNFSNYIATALSNTATNGIWIGSTQVVAGVVNGGSTNGQSGIYLVGTAQHPINVKGTVVIPGDVVIQGVVTGQGTLYVGGDLYIAGNLTYANSPNFSTPPETMSPTARDAWVASNQSTDLIAYAVRGSIFGGDVTASDWINYEYNYPGSGLQFVGDESHLGADGIAGTPDDNIPFLHADGTWSTWYDADGNGLVNANYNYSTDINMTTTRADAIQGYPTSNGSPVAYNTVATDNIGQFDGIFYTDHAAAIRTAASTSNFYGSIISRNEQIVFNNVCNFIYDSRVNSRYHNNPNSLINLGLPYGKTLSVNNLVELTPNSTGL